MEISQQLKNFIEKYGEQIDNNQWTEIYESRDWFNLTPTDNNLFTEILYQARINPLEYVKEVPSYFLFDSNLFNSNFKTFQITDGIESIRLYAFCKCENLESIVIPSSVKQIDSNAFYFCFDLDNIKFLGTRIQWDAIQKAHDWENAPITPIIHCIDGDIYP